MFASGIVLLLMAQTDVSTPGWADSPLAQAERRMARANATERWRVLVIAGNAAFVARYSPWTARRMVGKALNEVRTNPDISESCRIQLSEILEPAHEALRLVLNLEPFLRIFMRSE